ncbi:MAG TPA: biopolymer transporter Tol [Acidobacteriaceae bacterium]|nr:biopolymer transporter Tol [Acidobacteriaceae bacterium]
MRRLCGWAALLACVGLVALTPVRAQLNVLPSRPAQTNEGPVGLFDGHSDVGPMYQPSSAAYDAATGAYTLTAAGADMWGHADNVHFVWKKVSGDVSLAADIAFPTPGGHDHRKAVLMIRQTLEADSVYADAARHGNGMTALQYREQRGDLTQTIEAGISSPSRLRIEKQGDTVTMWLSAAGGPMALSGSVQLPLKGEFYVGLGVCSHDKDRAETAVFSHVELRNAAPAASARLLSAAP